MSTHSAPDRRVVVAVGTSAAGAEALRWAAAEAKRRGTVLSAVYVVERGRWPVHEERRAALETARQQVPDRVARALGWAHDDLHVAVRVVCGPLVDSLAQQARGACLLVVGMPSAAVHRNLPGRLVDRSGCPVVVVDESGEAVRARTPARARPA
jgi:K+-sensing histidine kinase KdpD